MRKIGLLAIVIVVLTLVGCAQEASLPLGPTGAAPAAAPEAKREAAGVTSTTSSTANQAKLASVQDRLIVKQATLNLVVNDPQASMEQVSSLANQSGGYVVSERSERRGDFLLRTMTIRVPAEKFDEVLKALRGMAVRIDGDDVQSQDVTEEYIDIDAQLRNLEATQQQYLALLKKTEQVEDVLKVHERLSQVQGDIERLKGRKQYLERSAAMSVITLSLTPLEMQRQVLEPGWSVTETLRNALRGAVGFAQALVTVVIWLVVLAIPLAVVIAPFWLLVRWVRRRRRPPAPVSNP